MRKLRGLVASLTIGCAACLLAGALLAPAPVLAASPAAEEGVRLVFRDGRTVEGTLVEETTTTIKVLVNVAGISAEAVYEKDDLLHIERGIESGADDEADEDTAPETKPADEPKSFGEGGTRIYLLELKGGLGREVSVTPLKQVLRDVKKQQPDILLVKIDMEFRGYFEREARRYEHFFDQFFKCHSLAPVLTDDIAMDREWKKKPKLVFWVRNAMGGIAFLPFNSPHIYYTSDARQGGVGYLDKIFEGVGDEVVREKQRSLRLGMAEGMAVRGGYDPVIIRAMTRSDYILSYDLVGGRPVYYENSDEGQWLLTDDGSELNADSMEDIVRGRGNDVLQLDAEKAFRLGISDGTADTIEELVSLMKIARNYTLIENKSERILEDWAEGVSDAELNFRRLVREFQGIEVQGDYQERTAARGRQIRTLRQMISILDRYGEAINPAEIGGYAEQFDQELSIIIERIKNLQRLDGPP